MQQNFQADACLLVEYQEQILPVLNANYIYNSTPQKGQTMIFFTPLPEQS
jgi:hypothetical protein